MTRYHRVTARMFRKTLESGPPKKNIEDKLERAGLRYNRTVETPQGEWSVYLDQHPKIEFGWSIKTMTALVYSGEQGTSEFGVLSEDVSDRDLGLIATNIFEENGPVPRYVHVGWGFTTPFATATAAVATAATEVFLALHGMPKLSDGLQYLAGSAIAGGAGGYTPGLIIGSIADRIRMTGISRDMQTTRLVLLDESDYRGAYSSEIEAREKTIAVETAVHQAMREHPDLVNGRWLADIVRHNDTNAIEKMYVHSRHQ